MNELNISQRFFLMKTKKAGADGYLYKAQECWLEIAKSLVALGLVVVKRDTQGYLRAFLKPKEIRVVSEDPTMPTCTREVLMDIEKRNAAGLPIGLKEIEGLLAYVRWLESHSAPTA